MKMLRFTVYVGVGSALAAMALWGRFPEAEENLVFFAAGLWVGAALRLLKGR